MKKDNEKDLTCALREIYEETGLKYDDYELIDVKQLVQTTNTYKVIYNGYYHIAEFTSNKPLKIPKRSFWKSGTSGRRCSAAPTVL